MKRTRFTGIAWYLVIAAFFLVLTNLVYVNFALRATPDYRYTGANFHAASDKLVYMSMIEQGRQGLLFMKNLHTTEPQRGLLLSPHWYLIGQTARFLNVSNNVSYQMYRIVGIILFLLLLYRLLCALFRRSFDRVIAALFVFATGGFGWFFLVRYPFYLDLRGQFRFLFYPVDTYVTEGNTMLNFTQAPLFIFAQLLLLLIFWLVIRYRRSGYRWDVGAAALSAILTIIHPYDAPIILAVLGSWAVWDIARTKTWGSFIKVFIVGAGVLVGTAYNIYMVRADPVLATWLAQNLVYSPPFMNYVWGYGLLLPLWAVGFVHGLRSKHADPWWMLILIWSGIVWLLLYAPLPINRRFVNGWHIALALVAYHGFRYLLDRIRHAWLRVAAASVAAAFLFSSVVPYLFLSFAFSRNAYAEGTHYISREEDALIDFLGAAAGDGDGLMLSDMKTGFIVSSQLPRSIFRGHDHQTPRSHLRQQQMDWFFSQPQGPRALERREQLLRGNRIRFVVINALRSEYRTEWIGTAPFLERVYASTNLTVYRLQEKS